MSEYELTFAVETLPEHSVDLLIDAFDATVGTTHGGQPYVTMVTEGDDCRTAARAAIKGLSLYGVHVVRLQEDFVTRSDIAERLRVTRQAVGLWARGERKSGFPNAVSDVGGGLWLWGDVARWAEQQLSFDAFGLSFPTLADHDWLNGELVQRELSSA